MLRLEAKRLILRDYEEADEDAYFQLKSDPRTMYYLQDIQVFNREQAKQDFDNVLNDSKDSHRKFYFFHVETKKDHQQVGSVGYTVTNDTPLGKLVHAGYFIYPQFWNQGYTTEAFQRVIAFAFLENNVYRITTGCLAENIGSERVMQKCGFVKEGELIDYEWHDGSIKTRLEYRLLKSEWTN